MSDKESAQQVIEAYRKRQQMSQRAPVIFVIAGILLVIGAAALIFWLVGGAKSPLALLASATPSPTITSTVTPSPTATKVFTPTSTFTPLPPTDTPTSTSTSTPSGPSIYVVQENDTLGSIATKFNTTLAVLIALNPSINPNMIKVGDKIVIPAPNTTLPTATALPTDIKPGTLITYQLVAGDTLAALAARFNSTLDAILKANPTITNANAVKEGDIIKIPVNIVTPVPTATQGTVLPTVVPPPSSTPTP